MIKKNLFALFVFTSLALAGCASNLGVYDPSVPQNRLCTLTIDSTLSVTRFDGKAVDWSSLLSVADTVIQIPAGQHSFVMDYWARGGDYIRSAENIRYSDTFEAGKSYVMRPAESNGRVFILKHTK